jgi:hypothetical protein
MQNSSLPEPGVMRKPLSKTIYFAVLTTAFLAASPLGICQSSGQTGTKASGHDRKSHDRKPMKLKADAPMWQRYLASGEQFHKQGNDQKAKQYYFEALKQLESTPPKSDVLTAKVARLEGDIMRLYPKHPKDGASGKGAAQSKLDEEEIAILQRIRRLDQVYPSDGHLASELAQKQQKIAIDDLNKNKSAQQSEKLPTK